MVKLNLRANAKDYPVEIDTLDGRLYVRLSGETVPADVGAPADGLLSVLVDGRSFEARVELQDREVLVEIEGEQFTFERADRADAEAPSRRTAPGLAEVKAPMPGKIVKLLVASGQDVESGQGLLLFEAMKMQNEIRSPQAGRVVDVAVREGQAVESKDLLLTVRG